MAVPATTTALTTTVPSTTTAETTATTIMIIRASVHFAARTYTRAYALNDAIAQSVVLSGARSIRWVILDWYVRIVTRYNRNEVGQGGEGITGREKDHDVFSSRHDGIQHIIRTAFPRCASGPLRERAEVRFSAVLALYFALYSLCRRGPLTFHTPSCDRRSLHRPWCIIRCRRKEYREQYIHHRYRVLSRNSRHRQFPGLNYYFSVNTNAAFTMSRGASQRIILRETPTRRKNSRCMSAANR